MDTFENINNINRLNLGIWGLMEIKLAPDNPNIILSFKSRVMEVSGELWLYQLILIINGLLFSQIAQPIFQVYDAILHN